MAREYYKISNFYPHLKFPQKYVASNKQIVCRSSWEIKFCQWCDRNSNVLEWKSEETVIPYLYPVDGRWHRYFVDFWIKVRTAEGTLREFIVEVKPYAETVEPKKPKKVTTAFINRINTYIKNQSKWKAASMFCENQQKLGKDISFIIITEKELFGK